MDQCSFCGKSKDEVAVIIQGPQTRDCNHAICNECVLACVEIIFKWAGKTNDYIEELENLVRRNETG